MLQPSLSEIKTTIEVGKKANQTLNKIAIANAFFKRQAAFDVVLAF
jgi:hypothetical protein